MNVKVDFDNIVVKEDKNDFNVKVLMLKGEKGDQGDGEDNVIEEVQVNGTVLPITNKAVNVNVPIIDSALSSSSTNPVQNKVIYDALSDKVDNSDLDNYYETSEVDSLLNDKVGVSALNNYYIKTETYNQNEIDALLNGKLNNDVLDTINSSLSSKANISDVANTYETITDHNTDIGTLRTQITSLASGSPLVASSTSGMTDTTKVYVNTTDGKWYYYDGSSWVAGGTYQSSQGTLSLYTPIITSSNYATLLPDLNSAETNHIYNLLFARDTQDKPANLPVLPQGKVETLIVFTIVNSIRQLYISDKMMFSRTKYGNQAWTSWDIKDNNFLTVITSNNYSSICSDVNNIAQSVNYYLKISNNSSKPANLPILPVNEVCVLMTEIVNSDVRYQVLTSSYGIYYRTRYNNTWNDWINTNEHEMETIQASNYGTLLPDLNLINRNCSYGLLFARDTQDKPANLPIPPQGKVEYLQHYELLNSRAMQIYYSWSSIFYRYKYSGSWGEWVDYSEKIRASLDIPKTIYVGSGQTYTTLKSAIDYANQYENVKIYVLDGTYDLYEEFGGDNYFNNYSSTDVNGLILKNKIHLIFSSNSKVVFENTSNNELVNTKFSPFNSGEGGFTIENLTLECSKCRYGIHDERGSSTDTYINKYINCKIIHDNSEAGYTQCLGGGLGKSGEIIIENCYFANPNATANKGIVSYHNNNSSTDTSSKSKIIVKDNYFANGTFRISWCGVSTLITDCIVTNNKLNSNIIHSVERDGTDLIQNTNLIAWNNTIS